MASLEDKIRADLAKTGFPTEILTAAVMESRGWGVVHNPSYLDDVEGRSREFDLRAYKKSEKAIGSTNYSAAIYLVTECKKSEKPWVFFTSIEKHLSTRLGSVIKWRLSGKQMFTDRVNDKSVVSDGDLREWHHYFREPRLARTFHQPFRTEKEHSQMIYSAVMSVVKATMFLTRQPHNAINWLRMFYPLIVFSGDLFEAQVQPDKEINLIRSKHLQLSFSYMTPGQQTQISGQVENEFVIDIVNEDHLNDFLKAIEKELEDIAAYFFNALAN